MGRHIVERSHHNYGNWTKGRFSEVVSVTGPARMLFLAGIGAEHEDDGAIQHLGDFEAQCRYAYAKLINVLARHDATLGDVVKQVTYVTDPRFQADAGRLRAEHYGATPLPAHTFLVVSQLAWPGMLVELDVTAMVAPPER